MSKLKLQSGVVVSNNMDKSIVVKIERKIKHPIYKKTIKRSKKYIAHDESWDSQINRLYFNLFGRKSDFEALNYWMEMVEKNDYKIDDKEFKEIMEKRIDVFKDKRESYLYNNTIKRWKDSNQRNPFDIAIDFINTSGAICFSSDGTWFQGNGGLLTGDVTHSVLYVCPRTNKVNRCIVNAEGIPNKQHEYIFEISWSRFCKINCRRYILL